MKIDFWAIDTSISSPRHNDTVIEWMKGLRERNVTRMELYNQPRSALLLVVTLADGSLYLIQRVASKDTGNKGPMNTIENITPSYFVSRPVIDVMFHPQSRPDLHLVLQVSCSVPALNSHGSNVGGRGFGLVVLLNTVRHALRNTPAEDSTSAHGTEHSTNAESHEDSKKTPLAPLWKDVYQLVQKDAHGFWEESLPERTNNLIRELIHIAAYNTLAETSYFEAPDADSTPSAYIYFIIAQVEALALREDIQFSAPSVIWDQSWVKFTPTKLWILSLPFLMGNNTQKRSPQIDARDLPHQYFFSETPCNTNPGLIGDGFIGLEGGGISLGLSCIKTKNQGGKEALIHNGVQSLATGSTAIEPTVNRHDHGSYKQLKQLLDYFCQIIGIAECPEITSKSPTPSGPHVWISDWQVATHLAWSYAWSEGFKAGQDCAKALLHEANNGKPHVESSLTGRYHSRALRAAVRLYRWAKTKKEVKNTVPRNGPATILSEQSYQALTGAAQQEAKECHYIKKQYEEAYCAATRKRLEYKKKASERAMEATIRRGGERGLDYVAQQEWQKLHSGSRIGRFCPDQGLVAKRWRKGFQNTYEKRWSKSWEATWLKVWEDAYQLANSKGIEFGVELAMREGLGRKARLDSLEKDSYKILKQYIKQDKVEDVLSNIRLLIQDLSHISGLVTIHNVDTYDNRVTIRALVPNKNQDIEDMSRILKQPVSRELSYMELKHFIIEQYFKEPWKLRASFKYVVSKSWENLLHVLGKADRL